MTMQALAPAHEAQSTIIPDELAFHRHALRRRQMEAESDFQEARNFMYASDSELERRLCLENYQALYSTCFGSYVSRLQEACQHALDLQNFPQFSRATPRILHAGETLFMQADDVIYGGSVPVFELPAETANIVSRCICYTHAKTGASYTVTAYAWEVGARTYNQVYVNGKCISSNDYALYATRGAWFESSLACLRMAMNTGETNVLVQIKAIPF